MIESIEFTNFKALRKTILPLTPFTLLLGPNGSGKTSVLQALQDIATIAATEEINSKASKIPWTSVLSITAGDRDARVEIKLRLRMKKIVLGTFEYIPGGAVFNQFAFEDGTTLQQHAGPFSIDSDPWRWLARMQIYTLDASAIARPVPINSGVSLQTNGGGLAAILDDLKDNYPERWNALLEEMCRWLPEYDYILFDKPELGHKGIVLRTKRGKHRIAATDLSQGTLIALALLTLAYLPDPPSLIGLEEIDRGLHPRLLRHLQDALYRLSYPESCGESRPPIQVIATTHSPYLLDLYRDHPEEIVLAQKEGLEVQMKRLTDIKHYDEILGDSPLSEVWYSGVLGGVAVKP